jgi:hypothetical protein
MECPFSIRQEVMSAARQMWLAREVATTHEARGKHARGAIALWLADLTRPQLWCFRPHVSIYVPRQSISLEHTYAHIYHSINSSTPLRECVPETTDDANGSLRTALIAIRENMTLIVEPNKEKSNCR